MERVYVPEHQAQPAGRVRTTIGALLDAIIDGRPWTIQDDLPFLLAGPFGVDWRAGHPPTEAPATSWEPTVLEVGHAVAEALHLDPLWSDDPTDDA